MQRAAGLGVELTHARISKKHHNPAEVVAIFSSSHKLKMNPLRRGIEKLLM